MDLTSINRYWGNDEVGESDKSKRLEQLLSEINEREKKRVSREARAVNFQKPVYDIKNSEISSKNRVDYEPSKVLDSNNIKSNCNTDFTIIPTQEIQNKKKVERPLPEWLANPVIISLDLNSFTTSVDDIPLLDKGLASLLKNNKITHFFPVQCKLISWMLEYHLTWTRFWPPDACICSPTGSGKTLSYVLPIIQVLSGRGVMRIGALVIVPTRNLATQVYKVFRKYVIVTDLQVIQLGSISKLEKEQLKLVQYDHIHGYQCLADIVITTPGRLVDHMLYTKGFSLNDLTFLVVDEADNVMTSSHRYWLHHLHNFLPWTGENNTAPYSTSSIMKQKPRRAQRLLFSATLSQDPEVLQSFGLFQPKLFASTVKTEQNLKMNDTKSEGYRDSNTNATDERNEFVGKYVTPKELKEYITVCSLSIKPAVLYHWIKANRWTNTLCFVDSVSNVHRLVPLLADLSSADPELKTPFTVIGISSELRSKDDHVEIISQFQNGRIDVLVTTDSMARGIDLKNVKCVVLYDVPKHGKTYVHRVGRTARAGRDGIAMTLVTPEQKDDFLNVLRTTGKDFITKATPDMSQLKKIEATYKTALEMLRVNIKTKKQMNMKKLARARRGWKEIRIKRIHKIKKFKHKVVEVKSKKKTRNLPSDRQIL